MTDNPAAFIATETGQQKTFTVTYTFPPGAVDAAKRCCELAGLTVVDLDDDSPAVALLANVLHNRVDRMQFSSYGKAAEAAAIACVDALRGGAA